MATVALENPFTQPATNELIKPEKTEKKKTEKKSDKKKAAKKTKKENEAAVAIVIMDTNTKQVLLLTSKKDENTLVIPRDDCQAGEHPEKAAVRILHEKAGIDALFLSKRIGCFSESNKKGKVVAHHWMYEVHNPSLLEQWPESSRKRVWMSTEDAIKASENKRMSCLALGKISF